MDPLDNNVGMTEPTKCQIRLHIGDDMGDNSCTFVCQLPPNHDGQHSETTKSEYMGTFTMTWDDGQRWSDFIWFWNDLGLVVSDCYYWWGQKDSAKYKGHGEYLEWDPATMPPCPTFCSCPEYCDHAFPWSSDED